MITLYIVLILSLLIVGLFTACSKSDSDNIREWKFEAKNIIQLTVHNKEIFWNNETGHGKENFDSECYIIYNLNNKRINISVSESRFYSIQAVYFDTNELIKYIAENDISVIKHNNEYKLRYGKLNS